MMRFMNSMPSGAPPSWYSTRVNRPSARNAYYLTGQYETAIELLPTSAKRLPGYRPSFVWLAAAAAQLGLNEEARDAAADVLRIQPDFTISWFLRQITLAKAEDADRLVDGPRKAGFSQ